MTVGTHQTPIKCTLTSDLENVSLKRRAIIDDSSAVACDLVRCFPDPFSLFDVLPSADESIGDDWSFSCGLSSVSRAFFRELSSCFEFDELSPFCKSSVFGDLPLGSESCFGDSSDMFSGCDSCFGERSAYSSYALEKVSSNAGEHKYHKNIQWDLFFVSSQDKSNLY